MKISIITVCLNEADRIERTLLSILNQTYKHIELIVVDGASTDGTTEILRKYKNKIDSLISETDHGIYDAMNKGINFCTGKYVLFMNGGDVLNDKFVISDVVEVLNNNNIDFIYGNHYWCDKSGERFIQSRPLSLMWQGISFSHQALFSKVSLMKQFKFNTNYKIVSDYEYYYGQYVNGASFTYYDRIISKVFAGGLSNTHFLLRTYERWKVVKKHTSSLSIDYYYIKIIIKHFLDKFLRIVGVKYFVSIFTKNV